CSNDGKCREFVERPHQDQEFTNKVTQTRNTHKRRNEEHQEECKIRELTTHTAHQTHITSMHTFVDLTTHNEQCSRRQTVSQHHDHQTLEGQDITCINRQ